MACETCYHAQIPSCADEIIIDAGLTPSTNYYWVLTDKFRNKYTQDATTNISGLLVINVTDDLPDGLLTPYSGDFTLQIFDTSDVLQEYTIDTIDYSCITISIFKATGDFSVFIPTSSSVVHVGTAQADQWSIADSFTGAIDGVNDTYTTSQDYQAGTLMIFYNGIRLAITTDYVELSANSFQLTFIPDVGDVLVVDYIIA